MKGPALRERLAGLLGAGFPGPGFYGVKQQGEVGFGDWVIEDLLFEAISGEPVPALFLRPPEGHNPVPAIVYCHAHGNRYSMGREELTKGRPSLQGACANDLQTLGIAALCLEMPCFGTRQSPPESARAKAALWRGDTLFGQMLSEQMAGLSYLAEHPLVDGTRLGAVGFSMGSTLAWWLAAMDERVRAASALCSFADLETLVDLDAHDGHGIYMTVPGLLAAGRSGQVAGLAAPRALQICVGLQDWSTPEPAFAVGRSDLEAAYEGGSGLEFHVEPEAGHEETPEMRAGVLDFLNRKLVEAPV